MRITLDEAKRAGEISRSFEWTDKELALVVSVTELTVSFLEGKGERWSLAIVPLREELEQLKDIVRTRKLGR